ncbi:hypothetical protein [Actinoallomurus rhizosphaericola]|uniref:hypothetical protein n=1 Tax=Actinoallomurus rhizosphaericola TaxID=2952536 RepID=UPI0020932D8E|nr:hypothetical protein [Actinoallomurus rhizosphaericola]MCO5998810.1 hypothetical protein [Actinoallomurus rhizosphaericola]
MWADGCYAGRLVTWARDVLCLAVTIVAWIAKEKLRDALNLRARITGSTPPERQVRDALARFYTWRADHDDIGELLFCWAHETSS